MTLRRAVVATHRWIGVFAAALWTLQALTGVSIVFHWEIDDAITRGAHRPTDWNAMERQITNRNPNSMWTTAGARDRYDVFLADGVIRIDGVGNVLRARRDYEKFAHGGWVDTIVVLHQSMLSGKVGRWIIGTSGAFLLSNLILGVIAAWPRRGQWKRALVPRSSTKIATLYSWHRALGLWLVIPAFFLVSAGVLLAFELQVASSEPPAQPSQAPRRVGLANAVKAALARFPSAEVSGIQFPTAENAMWSLTLKQPGELQRAYGKTRVFVSATDGHVIAQIDALSKSAAARFVDLLFPIHTGEAAGIVGRIVTLTIGLWLLSMIVLGLLLWWTRRRTARFTRDSSAP